MTNLIGDIRYAVRRAASRPGFTAIAILSLGLGIGANTAAFSLINAIVLRKTPLPHPERVAEVYVTQNGNLNGPFSYPDYRDLRDRGRATGTFSQFSLSGFAVATRELGDHVSTITGQLVNGDYFPMIGMRPALGRLLGPDDDITPAGHPVIVLSYDYWKKSFNGDSNVVGQTMRLSGRAYTIVGVAPKGIEGLLPGLAPSIYASIQMINVLQPVSRDEMQQRGDHSFFARVRLADGKTFGDAQLVIDRFVADMRKDHPKDWSPHNSLALYPVTGIAVNPLLDKVIVPAAAALMIVVGLVLVVACANLASFLLAQARDRQREIAIRLAIGASRGALVRQLLIESLLLAITGGLLGVLLSSVALRLLLSAKLPLPLPINLDVSVDLRVLTFALGAATLAGLLFGLLPALQATRADVIETIKHENAGGRGRRFNMRSALVLAQTSTSLVLLVTSALFLRSFDAQSKVNPGFGTAPAALAWMAIPTDRYDSVRRAQMIKRIESEALGMPGVKHVGITGNILLNPLNESDRTVNVDGFTPPAGERGFAIQYASADSGYFDAVGVKLLEGRVFDSSDRLGSPYVAIINDVMAKKFWPNGSAVGKTFRADTIYQVIGVTKATKIRSLGEPPTPFFFLAYAQFPTPDFWLVAGSEGAGDAGPTAVKLTSLLHDIDPGFMIIQIRTMREHLSQMVLPAQLGAVAFALFASLALVLAMIGVYGVVRYAVSRRTREVAIRLAVGARPDGVVRLLMREGIGLVGGGAVLGILVGFAMARGLRALLFGVGSVDPTAFIGAPLLLILVGIVAAYLPARRASSVDPASTLRAE